MIDISDIVADPDFATTFSVVHAAETINAHGRSVSNPVTTHGVTGTVIPDKESFKRLPDGTRQTGAITVYTTHRLASGEAGGVADIVICGGVSYTVMAVADFSRFGVIEASCELLPVNR